MLQQLTKREHTFSSQKGYEKGLYRVERLEPSQSYAPCVKASSDQKRRGV